MRLSGLRRLVAINCGATPGALLESELFGHERGAFIGAVKQTIGKIEAANHGTLFLDEIGDMPLPLQVKLLRFLQEQTVERIGGRTPIPVDVRLISASNVAIGTQAERDIFRSGLFYRLNPLTVRIPLLRERNGDPMLPARFFLNQFNRDLNRNLGGFNEAAVVAISMHSWPGNVRELENRVTWGVVMTDGRLFDAHDLELSVSPEQALTFDLRTARLRAEREVLQRALVQCNNRLSAAAKDLGVSRPTWYGLLEPYELMPDRTKPARPDNAG
jgi:two-component system NtrC family response regulator